MHQYLLNSVKISKLLQKTSVIQRILSSFRLQAWTYGALEDKQEPEPIKNFLFTSYYWTTLCQYNNIRWSDGALHLYKTCHSLTGVAEISINLLSIISNVRNLASSFKYGVQKKKEHREWKCTKHILYLTGTTVQDKNQVCTWSVRGVQGGTRCDGECNTFRASTTMPDCSPLLSSFQVVDFGSALFLFNA